MLWSKAAKQRKANLAVRKNVLYRGLLYSYAFPAPMSHQVASKSWLIKYFPASDLTSWVPQAWIHFSSFQWLFKNLLHVRNCSRRHWQYCNGQNRKVYVPSYSYIYAYDNKCSIYWCGTDQSEEVLAIVLAQGSGRAGGINPLVARVAWRCREPGEGWGW